MISKEKLTTSFTLAVFGAATVFGLSMVYPFRGTDETHAREALQGAGMTNVQIHKSAVNGAPTVCWDTLYATPFNAVSKYGEAIEGYYCSSPVLKHQYTDLRPLLR